MPLKHFCLTCTFATGLKQPMWNISLSVNTDHLGAQMA